MLSGKTRFLPSVPAGLYIVQIFLKREKKSINLADFVGLDLDCLVVLTSDRIISVEITNLI